MSLDEAFLDLTEYLETRLQMNEEKRTFSKSHVKSNQGKI